MIRVHSLQVDYCKSSCFRIAKIHAPKTLADILEFQSGYCGTTLFIFLILKVNNFQRWLIHELESTYKFVPLKHRHIHENLNIRKFSLTIHNWQKCKKKTKKKTKNIFLICHKIHRVETVGLSIANKNKIFVNM